MVKLSIYGGESMNIKDLIVRMYKNNIIKFGDFKLRSGVSSQIYIDVRSAVSYPSIYHEICSLYVEKIKCERIHYDLLCGIPYSGLIFASTVSFLAKKPMIFKRKEQKNYGTNKMLEGIYRPEQSVLVIEDVVTTGMSTVETVHYLRECGLTVESVLSLIDRNDTAKDNIIQEECTLYSIYDLFSIAEIMYDESCISKYEYQIIIDNISGD